jgi:hypothetical protein
VRGGEVSFFFFFPEMSFFQRLSVSSPTLVGGGGGALGLRTPTAIFPFRASTYAPVVNPARQPPVSMSSLFNLSQQRAYKPHSLEAQLSGRKQSSVGRSIFVNWSVAHAYMELRNVLQESKVRETVRHQMWFESKHDKRRRKRKEAEWRMYKIYMKEQIAIAKNYSFR